MHNIVYLDYNEDKDLKKITRDVLEYVNTSGDCYGTDRVTFLHETICSNRDEAIEYISDRDRDWYGGYAVKYYDFNNVSSKRIDELEQRHVDTIKSKQEYIKKHAVTNRTAAYIGCPKCGSRLSKKYLHNDYCPLCRADLRPESTQERIKKYEAKEKEILQLIKAEKLKHKSKAKVKWLVKFEYHS